MVTYFRHLFFSLSSHRGPGGVFFGVAYLENLQQTPHRHLERRRAVKPSPACWLKPPQLQTHVPSSPMPYVRYTSVYDKKGKKLIKKMRVWQGICVCSSGEKEGIFYGCGILADCLPVMHQTAHESGKILRGFFFSNMYLNLTAPMDV